MDQLPPTPPQGETQQPVSPPITNPQPDNSGSVSGVFKVAFVVGVLISAGFLVPGFIGISSSYGWDGIGTIFGWVLLWGFSITALLLTAFLKNILPNKLVSLIYGSTVGVIAALSITLVIFGVMWRGEGPINDFLKFMTVYVVVTLAVLFFARFLDGAATNRIGEDTGHIKKLSLLSLVIGLVFSLVISWVAHPDFRFDKPIPKSAVVLEYEECLSRQYEENFDGCMTPDDPYIYGNIPQRFGFPFSREVQANLADFSLYFFVLVPNWLLWSIVTYLVMGIWYRFKSSSGQNV